MARLMNTVGTAAFTLAAGTACGQIRFMNGPLDTGTVTRSGVTAPTGASWSEVQADTATCANTLAGLSMANVSAAFSERIADDFTITDPGGWMLTSVSVYGYVTGSGTAASPFTSSTLRIWNGRPGDPGSAIVFGDTTTNRLMSSAFTGLYRVFSTVTPAPGTAPGTTRPVFRNELAAGVTLPPGTYWLDWNATAAASANCFSPLVTMFGIRAELDRNGRQLDAVTGIWSDAVDLGNPGTCPDVFQDFPFEIKGKVLGDNGCYANCDISTVAPVLNINDFSCFLNRFAAGDTRANCDQSTVAPILNINDFSCFLNKFAAGCTLPPQASITSCSPATGGEGSIITINGANFGSNPDNLCIRLVPQGILSAHAISTTGTTLQARVAAVPPSASAGMWMIARGSGRTVNLPATLVTAPVTGAWAFRGEDGAQGSAQCASVYSPTASSIFLSINMVPGSGASANSLVATLPPDLCAPPPFGYPSGTILKIDFHFDIVCPGSTNPIHIDCYAPAITVLGNQGVSAVTSVLATTLQATFHAQGNYNVIVEGFGGGGGGVLRIRWADSQCTMQNGAGTILMVGGC